MTDHTIIRHDAIKKVADRRASGLAFRVLDYFIENADENGQVKTTLVEMAPHFDRSTAAVNIAVKVLIDSGVLKMERITRAPSVYTLTNVFPDTPAREVV